MTDSTQTADAEDLRLAAHAVEWAHDDGWCAKPCDCIEHMARLEALADIRPAETALIDAALRFGDSVPSNEAPELLTVLRIAVRDYREARGNG